MEDLADKEIAEKLRTENYEQYKQLVRMHLSFELDLNTDEFDLPCHEVVYYEKGKIRKWNRLTKKMKSCASSKTGSGSPIEGTCIQLSVDLIEQLRQLKEFLLKEVNLKQEGIFRRTGAVSRQNELRNIINQQKDFDLNENYTVHDCATVYKGLLADLAEPLLTDAHYPAHCQIADLCNGVEVKEKNDQVSVSSHKQEHLLNSMQLLVLLLPYENRILLEDIINMLFEASKHEKFNKMSPDTLATLFSPHLICPRNLPPEALHYVSQRMSSVISYMIFKGDVIFDIPPKLATDIRAYFHEIKRKKTMSPEHTLDESISDISTVNTVYTFVDREKTAAEHNSNPTDTALAQLYAHIQSMPESSKKRKLIKQFNKENGQGTPLQMLMVNRIKNNDAPKSGGKSFSDAIKKHIFHKGLISRTPKRLNSANTSVNNPSTPNGAIKTPRTRILFPSQIITNTNFQTSKQPQHSNIVVNLVTTKFTNPTSSNRNAKSIQHPLQKSISASSIISTTSTISSGSTNSLDTFDNSGLISMKKPISAPLSRFCSNEFENNEQKSNNQTTNNLEEVKQQLISDKYDETTDPEKINWLNKKQLMDDIDYNSDDSINEFPNVSLEKFLTPIKNCEKISNPNKIRNKLKSKYKSEPNLFDLRQQEKQQRERYCKTPQSYDDDNKNDVSFMDYLPKTIKNSLIKAVSLSSLIGNLSSTSNINVRSEKLDKINRRSISNRSIYFRNLNANKLNEQTMDSFKDCLSTIQSENEFDQDAEPSTNNDADSVDGNTSNYRFAKTPKFNMEEDAADNSEESEEDDENNSKLTLSNENIIGSYQNLNVYRNIDLITSTPSQFFRRRSMSPITKSTQRMPKAMQESIMTPRSRKPVMLMATAGLSHDQSQNVLQNELSHFNENEENQVASPYVREGNASKCSVTSKITKNHFLVGNQHIFPERNVLSQSNFFVGCGEMEPKSIAEAANITNRQELQQQRLKLSNLNTNASLSNTFREYLLSRSVLTASPVDSSFSSQPDDFGSTPEIQDINESQMSSSLLYCLDGNQPSIENQETEKELGIEISSCDSNKQNIIDGGNNSPKSTYINTSKDISIKNQQRKRNCNSLLGNSNENISTYPDDIFSSRKLLIIEENPNETSL